MASQGSVQKFEQVVQLLLMSHNEIELFYKNMEKMEEIYTLVYKGLTRLNPSFAQNAFEFYVKNHFEALLFVIDRIHELRTKISTCISLKPLIASASEEKLAAQSFTQLSCQVHLDVLLPEEKGLLIMSDCRDWLRGATNMLRSMFFSANLGPRIVRWRLHSVVHLKEKVEFAWHSSVGVSFLCREDCRFDRVTLASYIRNSFVPEYNDSTLVSQAMARLVAKQAGDRRCFEGGDLWTFLTESMDVGITSPVSTVSFAAPATVGGKRTLHDANTEHIKKRRPILCDEEAEFDCELPTNLLIDMPTTPSIRGSNTSSSSSFSSSLSEVAASTVRTKPFKSLSVIICDNKIATEIPLVKVKALSPIDKSVFDDVKPFRLLGATSAATSTTTAASFNWAVSALEVEDDVDLTRETDASSDEDSKEELDKFVVIDLTQIDSPVNRASNLSPLCTTHGKERSPSRRGEGFDDSTLEFSVRDNEEDIDDESSLDGSVDSSEEVAPSYLTKQVAENRYERLVDAVGRDLTFQLASFSRTVQSIADGLSCVPMVTVLTSRVKNRSNNEKTKLFLTEAVMAFSEASSALISLQSRLLLCASLKDQGFDPHCDEFSTADEHFTVKFDPYEALASRPVRECKTSSCGRSVDYKLGGIHVKRVVS